MLIPVTLEVPASVGDMIGFRPSRLPPFQGNTVRLSHIMPGTWASSNGLNAGDFLTHVNGISVSVMTSSSDFYNSISVRPVKLSFLIEADDKDLLGAQTILVGTRKEDSRQKVTELYDRLFGPATTTHTPEISSLFDAKAYQARAPSSSSSAVTISPVPTATGQQPTTQPDISPGNVFISGPAMPTAETATSTITKPVNLQGMPLLYIRQPPRLHVKILRGENIPANAGLMYSDPLWQPFSCDPYVEISLTKKPAVMMGPFPAEILRNCKPLGPQWVVQSAVSRNTVWNSQFSFNMPFTEDKFPGYLLSFFIKDKRSLWSDVDIGGCAVPLNNIPLWEYSNAATLPILSLEMTSYTAYDVSKSRLKIAVFFEASRREFEPALPEVPAEVESETPKIVAAESIVHEERGVQVQLQSDNLEISEPIPWMYRPWVKALSRR